MGGGPAPVMCRSYTAARRHPKVLGVVAGWVLPVPVTMTQLGVGMATGWLLWRSRGLWTAPLSGPWTLLVAGCVMVAAMWAARRVRIGGRGTVWAALGAATYVALRAWAGVCGWWQARPITVHACRMFVSR